jgi:hypothetical protein
MEKVGSRILDKNPLICNTALVERNCIPRFGNSGYASKVPYPMYLSPQSISVPQGLTTIFIKNILTLTHTKSVTVWIPIRHLLKRVVNPDPAG